MTAPLPDDANSQPLVVPEALSGKTVLAWLRQFRPDNSWSECRKWLASRRILVNGVVTVHEGRRLEAGDIIEVRAHGSAAPRAQELPLHHLDKDVVVVEKPPDIVTTRRPEELHWPTTRKLLAPTLDELTALAIEQRERPRGGKRKHAAAPQLARLWRVQRLDRPTSGLVVFARSLQAAEKLIPQFAAHSVERIYQAVVVGQPPAGRIESRLVRDRGDGLRGVSPDPSQGQWAVTHIESVTPIVRLSLITCRLETGRTHQIRIQLAELGHPVCGETRYNVRRDGTRIVDDSGAPRLALHAHRLGFTHPMTSQRLVFTSPLPRDLANWLAGVRSANAK